MRELAVHAATAAVHEAFVSLGIDTVTPAAVNQLQRDLNFLRDLRLSAQLARRRTISVLVGALASALFAYIALSFGLRMH